jgi:hypothetical protein
VGVRLLEQAVCEQRETDFLQPGHRRWVREHLPGRQTVRCELPARGNSLSSCTPCSPPRLGERERERARDRQGARVNTSGRVRSVGSHTAR